MSQTPREPGLVRLKKRREFLVVAGANRKWATPGMVVQVRNRPPGEVRGEHVRIGFTTSRKVGNAVVRNRARRRLRACVDAVLPGQVKPGLDIVVIGRQATPARPFAALKDDFLKSLKKLNALMDRPDRPDRNEPHDR
ncbi:MAG: ribonuclease P protein component [Rhodospirillales bacterium]